MKNEWSVSVAILLYSLACVSMPLSISGTELSLGILILALPFLCRKIKPNMADFREFPSLFFALYLFVPFLSLVNSPNLSVSLPWIRRHMFMAIIPVVIITSPLVVAHWKKFLGGFVAASTLAAGYAVLQVFFGENLSRPLFWKGYYVHSTAFFSQPNTLGEVLTFSLLAAILAIWLARNRWSQVSASGSVLLILAGIAATRTRTPLTVAVVAGGWLMVKLFGKRGVITVLLVLILALGANWSNERIFWRFHQINISHTERTQIWYYGVRAAQSHPILGIGYGNFREFLKTHVDSSHHHLIRYNHTHCNILEAAATTGVVGLIIFLLFWGRVAWDMFTKWRKARNPVHKTIFLTILTAFLAFHVEGLTECTLKDAEVALPLYVMIGIFYAILQQTGRNKKIAGESPATNSETVF